MTERGYLDPATLRTVNLPASGAGAGNLVEITGVDQRTCVGVGLHFTKGVKFAFYASSGSAIAGFAGASHGRLLSQASPLELGVVGDRTADGMSLWIERLSGAAVSNALTYWLVRGREQ